ncbi:MAG: GAF domain-containing protein [Cyanobacteria bacterium P01_A01_bin.135]
MAQPSLTDIAQQAKAITGAETAVVALAEDEGATLLYAAAAGRHTDVIIGKRSEVTASGLCGAALASGESELVCQTQGDLRVRQDLAESLGITTAIAAPIAHDNQILGALMVLNREDGSAFDKTHEAKLVAYVDEIADTLERNAQR